eukprot:CAMPEP_0203953324 /NCGR_PEP_ID=MMETSP0359-20131031/86714_1 /ASSEMBLY_ACC=CAM_ASM_000338 /TAXON_ID=268821 /ORGANISM="Scrippsiella Hangoei, Strain SHTV-5" /LENGTH=71 /DNA_ID=CAMNT_0050886585 /DNA_START=37 /DNA_END=248 /DNA_ORIENTATION=+
MEQGGQRRWRRGATERGALMAAPRRLALLALHGGAACAAAALLRTAGAPRGMASGGRSAAALPWPLAFCGG